MKSLYAPWRSKYTESTEQSKQEDATSKECIFCLFIKTPEHDEKNFILKRCAHTCVMFNRYPYNAGHLLVVANEHIAHLEHLSKDARTEMMELANISTTIIQKQAQPHGFNIGFNLGKAGGASIPAHIHMHILPRWIGDTGFLPTLGETKAISFDLRELYQDLKPRFEKVTI